MRSNGRAFQVVEVGALEGVLINAAALPLRADIRQSMSQLLHSFSVKCWLVRPVAPQQMRRREMVDPKLLPELRADHDSGINVAVPGRSVGSCASTSAINGIVSASRVLLAASTTTATLAAGRCC